MLAGWLDTALRCTLRVAERSLHCSQNICFILRCFLGSIAHRTRNSSTTHLARETVGIPNTLNTASTYCEIPVNIEVRIRNEWRDTIVLCASCGFKRGELVLTRGLGRMSIWKYSPWQPPPVQSGRYHRKPYLLLVELLGCKQLSQP